MSNSHSFKINPVTKDYELDSKGKPIIDKSLKTPAYFRLTIPRTKWMYYGSDYYLAKKNLTGSYASNVTKIADKALEPLIDSGRAIDITTSLEERSRHGAAISIKIQESLHSKEDISLIPVGE